MGATNSIQGLSEMGKIANVTRNTAVKVFGSVWLADDIAQAIVQHLGAARPALLVGTVFESLEQAVAARPGYRVVELPERVSMPSLTPIPEMRNPGRNPEILHEVHIFAFDDLMSRGIRVERAGVVSVEFDVPPPHLMGKVNFVASAVYVGDNARYKVRLAYDADYMASIVESPMIATDRGYAPTGQAMAFFHREDAAEAADQMARELVAAADWRSRSKAA